MKKKNNLKAVIVEDQKLMLDHLTRIVRDDLDFNLVGTAGNGEDACEVCCEFKPDFLLLDIFLPEINGFEVVRRLRKNPDLTDLNILMISSEYDPYTIFQVFDVGVQGYIDKIQHSEDTLAEAINKVAGGGFYYSPLSRDVRDLFASGFKELQGILTVKEQAILFEVGQGYSNEHIAGKEGLSPKTVQRHRQKIMDKLDIHDTPSLMRYAVLMGIWRYKESDVINHLKGDKGVKFKEALGRLLELKS